MCALRDPAQCGIYAAAAGNLSLQLLAVESFAEYIFGYRFECIDAHMHAIFFSSRKKLLMNNEKKKH